MAKRTASAKKQARAGARRTVRNRAVRSSVKTLIVKARRSLTVSSGSDGERREATIEALRSLDRAAAKRILHPKNAARRKSRLAKQLAKLGPAATPAPAAAAPAKGGKATPAPAKKK